jgi:hypothetical protein
MRWVGWFFFEKKNQKTFIFFGLVDGLGCGAILA